MAKEIDEDEGNFALLKLKEIGDDDLFKISLKLQKYPLVFLNPLSANPTK